MKGKRYVERAIVRYFPAILRPAVDLGGDFAPREVGGDVTVEGEFIGRYEMGVVGGGREILVLAIPGPGLSPVPIFKAVSSLGGFDFIGLSIRIAELIEPEGALFIVPLKRPWEFLPSITSDIIDISLGWESGFFCVRRSFKGSLRA